MMSADNHTFDPPTPPRASETRPPSAWGPPNYAPALDPRRKSPVLAGGLSILPGLGQVYLGLYVRGFIHAIAAATTITLLASGDLDGLEPLFGMLLPFLWFFSIIDAIRTAMIFNHALAGLPAVEMSRDVRLPPFGGSIAGG